jgi:hypothetical protein
VPTKVGIVTGIETTDVTSEPLYFIMNSFDMSCYVTLKIGLVLAEGATVLFTIAVNSLDMVAKAAPGTCGMFTYITLEVSYILMNISDVNNQSAFMLGLVYTQRTFVLPKIMMNRSNMGVQYALAA